MATPKNFINSVVYAKPDFSQADGLPRFYPTVDLQGGNIENVVLINGELPITVPPTGGYVRYDACDGTIYDISVNLMSGSSNIQLGYQAGDYGKGSRNVMIGYFAANGTGTDLSDSVVIGTQAGVNSDGSNNIYLGPYSGYYTGGSNNVFIGSRAGYDMSGINNNNIFLGRNAGQFLTDVSDTLIVGDASDVLIRGHMKNHMLDICGDIQFVDGSFSRLIGKDISLNGGLTISNPSFSLVTLDTGSVNSYMYGPVSGASGLNIGANYYQDNLGNNHIDNSGRNTSRIFMTGLSPSIAFYTGQNGQVPTNLGYTQDGSGNVGIGKIPNYNFDVSGNIASSGIIGFSVPTTSSVGDLSANISSPSLGTIAINTNTTERMRVNSSGMVGIGTSTPNYTLDISGQTNITSNGGDALILAGTASNISMNNTDGTAFRITPTGGSAYLETTGNLLVTGPSGGSLNRFVGINKTNPAFNLDVSGNTNIVGNLSLDATTGGYKYLKIQGGPPNSSDGYIFGSGTRYSGGLHLGCNFYVNDPSDGTSSVVIPNSSAATSRITMYPDSIRFLTGGVNSEPTTLGLFQGGANVGIGTTNPTEALDVCGNLRVSSSIKATKSGSAINGPYYTFKYDISSGASNSIPSSLSDICTNAGFSFYDKIALDSNNNIFSYGGGSSITGVYTAPVTGIYNIGFYVRTSDNPADTIFLIYNSTTSSYYPDNGGVPSSITNGRSYAKYSTIQYLTAGDKINMQGETSGGGADITTLEFYGYLLHSV